MPTANQKDSLNTAFSNEPQSIVGGCPMKGHIAIFPVRYALDEASENLNSSQGPHTPAKPAEKIYPALQTRSYAVRQIRDGWLYVVNLLDKTMYEYKIEGHLFSRNFFRDEVEVHSDIRDNLLPAKPYIECKPSSKLYIAYSPKQWTWSQCEKFRSNFSQSKWITVVDLAQYSSQTKIPEESHIQPLSELGKRVIDIKPNQQGPTLTFSELSKPAIDIKMNQLVANLARPTNRKANGEGDFFSTTVATKPRSLKASDMPEQLGVKPIINENQILGNCPDRHSAIMVVVNDPIGILDDLLFNLVESWTGQAAFEKNSERKINTAMQCLQMAGGEFLHNLITNDAIKNDDEKKFQCIKELNNYLKTEALEQLYPREKPFLEDVLYDSPSEKKRKTFMANWGFSPDASIDTLKKIEIYDTYQAQIRFNELLDFLIDCAKQQKKLATYIAPRETDLKTWLTQLDNNVANIFMDEIAYEHAKLLIDRIAIAYKYLIQTEDGKNWLSKELQDPVRLIGSALYLFNGELTKAIQKLAEQLVSEQGIKWDESYLTNMGSRAGEISTVLGLDAGNFQHSIIYKTLSQPAQHAFTTLTNLAKGTAKNSIESISRGVLAALNTKYISQNRILSAIIPTVLVPIEETNYIPHITVDPKYTERFNKWWPSYTHMRTRINELKGTINTKSTTPQIRKEAIAELAKTENILKRWMLHQPEYVTCEVINKVTRTIVKETSILNLGRAEAILQLEAKLRSPFEFAQRQKAWLNQKFGGSLPLIIAGLNIWNFKNTLNDIQKDGTITATEYKQLLSTGAYSVNAVMALWVMPMWSKYSTPLIGMEQAIVSSSIKDLMARSTRAAATTLDKEALAIAKQLSKRAATFAAIGAFASGIEAWMTYDEYKEENDKLVKGLILAKGVALGFMTITGLAQLTGILVFSHWFSVGWVFGPVVGTVLMVAGLAYLLFTTLIMVFKRNNLQKWMDYSYWGRQNANKWTDTDEGFIEQTNTLNRILMEPVLLINKTTTSYSTAELGHDFPSSVEFINGFWLGIQLPEEVAGMSIKLNPLLLENNLISENKPRTLEADTYQQLFAVNKGQWLNIPAGKSWSLPTEKPINQPTPQTDSTQLIGYRHWQIWVEYNKPGTILELQLTYPKGILTNPNGEAEQQELSYYFKILTANSQEAAEVKNSYFEQKLSDKLSLPNYVDNKRIISLQVPE